MTIESKTAGLYAVIDSSKTYTAKSLAHILGRPPRWVLEKLIYEGLEYFDVGHTYFITGQSLMVFVQENSKRHKRALEKT